MTTERLLYRIAHAYYEEHLTQAEIGERFGISRMKASRLLTKALDEGIVRITLVPPAVGTTELERDLESRYGLLEAIVVDAPVGDYDSVLTDLGRAAADYVVRVVQDGQTLGLTWGNSILATANSLPALTMPNLRVVQLIGGLGALEAEIHGAELVRRTAERLGAKPRNLHTPGIVASASVRDALVADPQVADTLELGHAADVALLGIGALGPHSVLRYGGSPITEEECAYLTDLGVVGDIALQFIDQDGEFVKTSFSDRIVGVDLPGLKSISTRVGVGGGQEKYQALRAALRGGHINVVVTDKETARALLKEPPAVGPENERTVDGTRSEVSPA